MPLANNGPVVAGPDLDAALHAAEELEEKTKLSSLYLILRDEKSGFLIPAQVADLRGRSPF